MKIRPKAKCYDELRLLLKEEYQVISMTKDISENYTYCIFNDHLHQCWLKQDQIEIVDDDQSDMVFKNTRIGKGYFNKEWIDIFESNPGNDEGIWLMSKSFRFFENNAYEIPEAYKEKVFDEQYKMNLIAGFLIAVNPYIEEKFYGGGYFENFKFYKGEPIEEISLEAGDMLEELNRDEYRSLLHKFIEKVLFDKEPGEEKSKKFLMGLLSLIDSLFVYDIDRAYSYQNYFDDCFIINYQSEYYYLNKTWWG